MKKLFSLFTLMVLALSGLSAYAQTNVNVTVDSKDRVIFGYCYKMMGIIDIKTPLALENDGLNVVSVPVTATSLYVEGNGGATITNVTLDGSALTDWSNITTITEGMKLNITSSAGAAAGTVHFVCDDYTLVNVEMRTDGGAALVELTGNECDVEYTANATAFAISAKSSENPILKVYKNDVEVTGQGFSSKTYTIEPLVEGITVRVVTKEEVVNYPVTFKFSDDHAKSYITSVTVDDAPITDFDKGFEVQNGKNVTLYYDSAITDVKVKANGEEKSPISIPMVGSFYSIPVSAATEIEVYTVVPEKKNITVNVDNAAVVEVGYKEDYESIYGTRERSVALADLVDGDNAVEALNTWKCLYVKTKDSLYEIDAVTVGGSAVADVENIAIENNMVLKVTSKHVPAIGSLTVTSEDFTLVKAEIRGESGARSVPLNDMTVTVDYYTGDFALVISAIDPENSPLVSVTCNGSDVSPRMDGTFIIDPIADGMQINVRTNPTYYKVVFEFSDENARDYVNSVTSNGTPEEDFDAPLGFYVTENAHLVVNLDPRVTNVNIFVNGEAVEPIVLPDMTFITNDITGDMVYTFESVWPKYFYLNIDHPDFVTIGYNNALGEKVPFEGLMAGGNELELSEDYVTLYVEPVSEKYEITRVAVDTEELAPADYLAIPVCENALIDITTAEISGIEAIIADSNNADVYNLQGIIVLKAANAASVANLPAGLYIVNGTKVLKR
ncbi:MAG: hypothetical protein HUK14_05565 [Muribaculaceae bacterium]|nr:hypothetical protein [Muribaculaceae bacterium]